MKINGVKALILLLCVAFAFVTAEDLLTGTIGFSGLLAVMAIGVMFAKLSPVFQSCGALRKFSFLFLSELRWIYATRSAQEQRQFF